MFIYMYNVQYCNGCLYIIMYICNCLVLVYNVGRLIAGSPAEQCGQLQLYDELLVVNDVDVSQMDHGDVVQQIKASGTSIKLVVQQPDGEWVCALCMHWFVYIRIH